jgi:predicted nucleotidyltransferase
MHLKFDIAIESLTEFIAVQPDIRLAIVFGSLANGKSHRDSDLDIAVLGKRPLEPSRRIELSEALSQLTGRPIDLIDLQSAGVAVARSAVLFGTVIFSRDEAAYPSQLSKVLFDSADFLPYRNRILKERRDAWTK